MKFKGDSSVFHRISSGLVKFLTSFASVMKQRNGTKDIPTTSLCCVLRSIVIGIRYGVKNRSTYRYWWNILLWKWCFENNVHVIMAYNQSKILFSAELYGCSFAMTNAWSINLRELIRSTPVYEIWIVYLNYLT